MSLQDARLTNPFDSHMAAMMADTFPSMAHWAGSGPAGMTCRQCDHWKSDCGYKRNEVGDLLPRRCRKFSRLSQGLHGHGVPHFAKACRHFIEQAAPPPVVGRNTPKAA